MSNSVSMQVFILVLAAGYVFGVLGLVAFIRLEKLIKTLKKKGILEEDYKEE